MGNFDPNQLPIFQFINWVKAYKYTPGQGPDGSDFTLDWTDNFDTFDASRWAKGPDALPLEGPPRGLTDQVLDDEFPLSMFYEALSKKMAPVIESTAGITGSSTS